MKISIYSFLMVTLLFVGCNNLKPLETQMAGTVINLSRRGLTEIPPEIFENKSIKVLKLFGNDLTIVPEEIGQLENLEKLYLGRNKLTKLPESIGQLKKLKILSVSYNLIDTLPISLGEMSSFCDAGNRQLNWHMPPFDRTVTAI